VTEAVPNLLPTLLDRALTDSNELLASTALITFLNPYSYLVARRTPTLFESFRIGIDGIGLVWFLRVFCGRRLPRVSFDMTSIAPLVFQEAVRSGRTVGIVGARNEDLEAAVARIEQTFSGIRIIAKRNGYFASSAEQDAYIQHLLEIEPQIMIVGMGTPLQERFLLALRAGGWKGIGLTCGGFLHQTARAMHYYPRWIDRWNLRWLYRVYDEPRLARRYLIEYPRFLWCGLVDRTRMGRRE